MTKKITCFTYFCGKKEKNPLSFCFISILVLKMNKQKKNNNKQKRQSPIIFPSPLKKKKPS